MKESAFYDKIKARAVVQLRAGINGHSFNELPSLGLWTLRNNIGVALCMARDEVWARAVAVEPWEDKRKAMRRADFNKGNFRKAGREIAQMILGRGSTAEVVQCLSK